MQGKADEPTGGLSPGPPCPSPKNREIGKQKNGDSHLGFSNFYGRFGRGYHCPGNRNMEICHIYEANACGIGEAAFCFWRINKGY